MPRTNQKKTFVLVDGHALIHRGFHAIPFLSTSKGEPTNGVFGFASIMLNAIKELKPEYVAVAFDLPKPTFRHQQYVEYKAHRKAAPTELNVQIPRVKEVVRALNIPIYEQEGYEADDLIGTLATRIAKEQDDINVVVVTGDYDTMQLVSDRIRIYTPKKGFSDSILYGPAEVQERYGLKPTQMVDYRALKGDPSDNIPGVSGIGEKTASDLISRFGSLDNLYEAVEAGATDIKPKALELLKNQKEQAYLSRDLSRIITDVEVAISLDDCHLKNYDIQKVTNLFQELEFKSLIAKLPKPEVVEQQAEQAPHKPAADCTYRLITEEDELKELIDQLREQKRIAVDTETTSVNALEAKIVGISLAWEASTAYYVHVWEKPKLIEMLKPILEDSAILKVGHNIKYDYHVFHNVGVVLGPLAFDSMIASYLLNPGSRQHDLDTVAFNEFGHEMIPIDSLIGKGKNELSMTEVPLAPLSDYACEDADFTLRLVEAFMPRLAQDKVDHLLTEIEMPLVTVLASMERWGIALDTTYLKNLSIEFHKLLAEREKKIHEYAGRTFNISSPSQLATVLFEDLGLDRHDIKKTKTGISTAATELAKLAGLHPIIDEITDYRELSKLISTYIDSLPLLVSKTDNRVHTSYNQTIAATGRLSSTDPNLQNIPIRTEQGQQIRKAFVAEDGYSLLSLDCSQIELRIAATLARDEAMLTIFKSGADIHRGTAARIFGIPEEEVSASQRRDAKTINFSVLYGVSAFGLSQRSGMNRNEAKEFIDKYFEAFPGITAFIHNTAKETVARGYVVNPIGRRRYFPEIRSSNFAVRSAAERAAVNMPIQSLSADIIKMAMIKIYKEFREDVGARMLLQVHDELVFEVKKGKEEEYARLSKNIMESVYSLEAGVVVDAKTGNNWGEMTALEL